MFSNSATSSQYKDSAAEDLSLARRLLYVSHLFAKGTEVAWQFCLVLFLAAFTNYQNLILVSTYGLFAQLVICMIGGKVGEYIDAKPRLFAVRLFIWAQNCCVLLATLFSYLLLKMGGDYSVDSGGDSWIQSRLIGIPSSPYGLSLVLGFHLFGAAADLLDKGITVSIERDWVVVMSNMAAEAYSITGEEVGLIKASTEKREKKWLSETNVIMTQIDLSCQTIAPALAGFFVAAFDDDDVYSSVDLSNAALFMGALNVVCLVVEWFCTAKIYELIPDLALKERTDPKRATDQEKAEKPKSPGSQMMHLELTEDPIEENKATGYRFLQVPSGWKIYMEQPVAWGGLSLALLYLNILCFGAIMTAYLVWRGMRLETIGVWRGISAVIGLLGTFAFNYSVSKVSIESTGMWSVLFQFLCLTISYASLFVENYMISLSMLIGGVCASRIGLWVFDIAIKQLMQAHVAESVRGVVGGIQQSLHAFFSLLMYALGVLYPKPEEFFILVATGYVCVGIASLMYGFGIYFRRDKLEQS